MKRLLVRLPKPHKKQAEIIACTLKRILINAGRRAGKTFLVALIAVPSANKGKRVLYIAPTSNQTDAFWELCLTWLADAIAIGLVKKDSVRRTLTYVQTGGRIQAKTGKLPDHLRGGTGDVIILDEFAFQNYIVWTRVCQPMTVDTNAVVFFISTPNFRNFFYLMYLRALNNLKWAVYTFSTLDNPHLSQEAIDELVVGMTELDYKQEILAQFVPGEGQVFSIKEEDFYPKPTLAELLAKHIPERGVGRPHRLCAGLDWGQKNDFTVLSIGCADCMEEIWLERTNLIDYPSQRDVIKNVFDKFEVDIELLGESNSMGLPNIQELRKDGIDCIEFWMSNTSKGTLVQGLRLCFVNSVWKWLEDDIAWNELEAYEMKVTPSGARTYNAPQGLNDDTVTARMLMLHQATQGRHTLV